MTVVIPETQQPTRRPAPRCPRHNIPLDGGPVRFYCGRGHSIPAADIDHEYHPPAPRTEGNR